MRYLILTCLIAIAFETTIENESGNHSDDSLRYQLLKETVNQLNDRLQKPFYYVLFDVNLGEAEVHVGKFHRFTLTLAPSSCLRGIHRRVNTLKECKIIDEEPFQKCFVELEYQPMTEAPTSAILLRHDCSVTSRKFPENLESIGFSAPPNARQLYNKFKDDHQKQYTLQEDAWRFNIFKSNLRMIALLNAVEQGSADYGTTRFADMTQTEFKLKYLTMKWDGVPDNSFTTDSLSEDTPKSFDWRPEGAVTDVKDQGECESSWAFSVVGNIEGQWSINKRILESLSVQQLIDCDQQDKGCRGGLPSQAYQAIIKSGGLMSEKDYPYEFEEDPVCHFKLKKVSAYINDSVTLPKDESKLADWLAKNGPISVALNSVFLQYYLGGIIQPFSWMCPSDDMDQAVLLVGYGITSILERPFWIVKNSWGESWGESGYFRIHRGTGACGINQVATSAVVA